MKKSILVLLTSFLSVGVCQADCGDTAHLAGKYKRFEDPNSPSASSIMVLRRSGSSAGTTAYSAMVQVRDPRIANLVSGSYRLVFANQVGREQCVLQVFGASGERVNFASRSQPADDQDNVTVFEIGSDGQLSTFTSGFTSGSQGADHASDAEVDLVKTR